MAASISVNFLGTILHCWSWVVAHVQNGLCPYHSTIFTSKSRWLDPGCLQGNPPPGQPPSRKGFGVLLLARPPPCQGPFRPGADTATPWHCLIYHIGVTCGTTPGKSGGKRRRRRMPANFFGMFSSVFHHIYNMLLHFLSCSGDRLLYTEYVTGWNYNISKFYPLSFETSTCCY